MRQNILKERKASKRNYRNGKCISSEDGFNRSNSEWFIVYIGTRILQHRDEVEKWDKDVLEYRTIHGQLFEAEEI